MEAVKAKVRVGYTLFPAGQNEYAVRVCIPSMYKSLKVEYVHKHTTLGFDKKARYKEGVPCQSGNLIYNPCRSITIHLFQETL